MIALPPCCEHTLLHDWLQYDERKSKLPEKNKTIKITFFLFFPSLCGSLDTLDPVFTAENGDSRRFAANYHHQRWVRLGIPGMTWNSDSATYKGRYHCVNWHAGKMWKKEVKKPDVTIVYWEFKRLRVFSLMFQQFRGQKETQANTWSEAWRMAKLS